MKSFFSLAVIILVTLGLLSCGSGPGNSADNSADNTPAVKDTRSRRPPAKTQKQEKEEYSEDEYTEEEDATADGETPGDAEYAVDENYDGESDIPASQLLLNVTITPRRITAGSDIKVNVRTAAPLKNNQSLSYKFWKNRIALDESSDNTLPGNTLKKNDTISVQVLLYENGDIVAEKESPVLAVLNSPPLIENVTLPDIQGAGIYEFTVTAADSDEDQITFSLELGPAAQDLDAQIDPSTGTVTCTLSDQPPESLKFTVVADDGEGGVAKKIVSIRLFKYPKKKEE